MTRVGVVGGAGYAGGELLRLLVDHPHVEVAWTSSGSQLGRFVHTVHPNLRGRTKLKFIQADDGEPVDVLFLAMPHGVAAGRIEQWAQRAERLVDLSADFRLRDPARYERWYGAPHPAPDWLPRFVYGLPELHRDELRGAAYASGVGCNATATNLALWPLARAGLVERAVVEVKVGSSEAGAKPGGSTHHAERSGAVRSFAPTGHRHQAEMEQTLGGSFEIAFSATAVELVRGVLCTAHLFLKEPLADRDLWKLFREAYGDEPFVRIVKERHGLYRYPEPKIVAGSNYCDVGFERDPASSRVVVMSAIDNLMKGAAGSAVQSMNLMLGVEETAGLGFPGLHPV